MKTVQIIELLQNEKEKYRVIHDFNKSEVDISEVESIMKNIIQNMRSDKDPNFNIKDSDVHVVMFEDGKLVEVYYLVEIWDNIPSEYINYYADAHDNVKDFIECNKDFISNGFFIDLPFCAGEGLFEYINQN